MTAAIALFVFGAATVLMSLDLSIGTLRAPGSGFFPLVLGLLLATLAASQGAMLYLTRLKQAQPAPVPSGEPPSRRLSEGTRRVMLFMGAVALAVALLPLLGYPFASLILMLTLLRILGVASWPLVGTISVTTAIACHVVFVRVLGIPLPAGMVGF